MLSSDGSGVPGLVKVLKHCASPSRVHFGELTLAVTPVLSPPALPISATTQYSSLGFSDAGMAILPAVCPGTPGGQVRKICDVAQKFAGTWLAGGSGIERSPCRRPSSPGMLATNSTDVYSRFFIGQGASVACFGASKLSGASCGESSTLPAVIQSP